MKVDRDARSVRRAIALLEVDGGEPVAHVAASVGATRQTIYNWIERYESEGLDAALRFRAGRRLPTIWTEFAWCFLLWSLRR